MNHQQSVTAGPPIFSAYYSHVGVGGWSPNPILLGALEELWPSNMNIIGDAGCQAF